MLGKLLKYEFKITGRTLLPIYGALLAITLLVKFVYTPHSIIMLPDGGASILYAVIYLAYGCIISATGIVTVVLLIQRFYKNLLRDEGYLMNTLPVSVSKNIAAKLITATFWSVMALLAGSLSVLLIAANWQDIPEILSDLSVAIRNISDEVGLHWLLYCLEILLLTLVAIGTSILGVYLALAIGHMANSHKISCSVAAYIGLSVVSSAIDNSVINLLIHSDRLSSLFRSLVGTSEIAAWHIAILSFLAFALIFFIAYFLLTSYVMKRHLNLE
jgi:hypothetical protein